MKLKKNDFIEIEFIARIKNTGEVFDTNIKKEAEKINMNLETNPFVFPLGQSMFLKGVENYIMKEEISKFPAEFKIELTPENAFGKRDPKLIQRIPMNVLKKHNLNPSQGDVLNFDGKIAKVIAVSGGRVLVDFNNPVAGKDVVYEIKILKQITDLNEKIRALMGFLFKKEFDFEIKNKRLIINLTKENSQYKKFIELFKDKFKEILGLELDVESEKDKPKIEDSIEAKTKENQENKKVNEGQKLEKEKNNK